MSQDNRLQPVVRKIRNDRPIKHDVACECGGVIYIAPGARYAQCSNGELRCTVCHRVARRFGKALTCGVGCTPHG